MQSIVPVPHRRSLPTAEIAHRYGLQPTNNEYWDDQEEANHLTRQAVGDYAGYPAIQQQIVADTLDDLVFRREVHQAAERINGVVSLSGVYHYDGVKVKDETVQLTRAYKLRGATNFILKHESQAREAGVVTASAGNHGQAVALAAAKIGVTATVVVPEGTPLTKRDGIESYGGQVIVYGSDYGEANDKALELNAHQQGLYVPAYNHRDIMAGQATMALELCEQVPGMTDLVVPTGGGGALAGTAKYLKTARPDVRVWGSGVTNLSAVETAFRAGNYRPAASCKFADGIAVAQLGSITWPEIKRHVDGVITANEQQLRRLVGRLSLQGHEVEGAGAIGLASILANRPRLGTHPVTIATGGNIDQTELEICRQLAETRDQ